jgi:hypothetical protein
MANIDIKLTQSVVDLSHSINLKNGVSTKGSLVELFDSYATLTYDVLKAYPEYSSYSWVGSTLTFNFADGATKVYKGVVKADVNALKGAATATSFEFHKDGAINLTESGSLNLLYDQVTTNGVTALTLNPNGSTTNAATLASLFSPSSASYNANYGNISRVFNGAIVTDALGNISGNITKVTTTAEKFVTSSVIEGNFQVSGNSLTMGQGLSSSTVSGNMTGYKVEYVDGSYQRITNGSTSITSALVIDEKLFADATRFTGNDVINIDLPSTTYYDFLMASGLGNDQISIKGGGGRLNVNAGDGNDVITVGSGSHTIDGGAGSDLGIFASSLKGYLVSKVAAGYQVKAATGTDVDIFSNVERLHFSDNYIGFDLAGIAGQAFRLYQAAFDRKPDLTGLGYWINDMDKGSSLTTVAAGFMQSPEFQQLYGTNPSTTTLLTNFYKNILHRAPDQAGFDYWANELNTGKTTPAAALASFCEDVENQALVIGSIQNGIEYTPWLG